MLLTMKHLLIGTHRDALDHVALHLVRGLDKFFSLYHQVLHIYVYLCLYFVWNNNFFSIKYLHNIILIYYYLFNKLAELIIYIRIVKKIIVIFIIV